MKINLSIANPFSSKFHCMREFKENLSGRQQVAAVAAAIFASIIPVLGSTAAFRKVVNHYHREIPQVWQDRNFIKTDGRLGNTAPDLIIKKLLKAGVTPENLKFTRIWTTLWSPGNNNNMIGGSERYNYGSPEDLALYDADPERNLFLYIALSKSDFEDAKKRMPCKSHAQVLTREQACGDEPLPKAFVDFITK